MSAYDDAQDPVDDGVEPKGDSPEFKPVDDDTVPAASSAGPPDADASGPSDSEVNAAESDPGADEPALTPASEGESAPEADSSEGADSAAEDSADALEDSPGAEVIELVDPQAALKDELGQAQARLRTVSKAYTDLQSEMKSFRERMTARSKGQSELQMFQMARTFFDPVMNLRRSLNQPGDDLAVLLDGLRMVQKQFMDAMTQLGLEEIPGEGAVFDPNLHEALAVTPVSDSDQDGKVLMVHTVGYRVNGKVLQAAQVVIGKHEETVGEA